MRWRPRKTPTSAPWPTGRHRRPHHRRSDPGVVVIEFLVPILLGAVAGSVADRVNPAVGVCRPSIVPALALMGYLVAPAGLVVMGMAIGLIVNIARPF